MASKTQRFRQLIEAEEILIQPGIYDGFSARLVQQMGFKSAAVSGAGLSEARVIERPDLAVSFQEINDLMGFGTIKDMEQRFLTAAQKQAKYGAAQ
jgi:2-methylisocitrate lyase-like PEP mutase family enzyme